MFASVPVAQLAWFLSVRLHTDVIDQTGLKGSYDFTLAFTPDIPTFGDTPVNAPPGEHDYPPLPEAVQNQLGLQLRSQKRSVQVLVIDYAEKPIGN
jgi:uncharacterized protein (TIGR03435 family)